MNCRFLSVWRRHARVWRRQFASALVANFGEPLIYIFGLGYGIGQLVGEIDGLSYLTYIATGMICMGTMMTTAFEATFSAFTRLDHQQTWAAQLAAPLDTSDIVLGEIVWAATKGTINSTAIWIVAILMGLSFGSWQWLALPFIFLTALSFASMAMIVTALAKDYEFFTYFMTLFLTPMSLLSGVFFPFSSLPTALQWIMSCFPLSHSIQIIRPLLTGQAPEWSMILHLSVILVWIIASTRLSMYLAHRRMIN